MFGTKEDIGTWLQSINIGSVSGLSQYAETQIARASPAGTARFKPGSAELNRHFQFGAQRALPFRLRDGI